ncbi:hypothetical protein [Pseudorhodoplanes sinuspersici]|uniref:Uncharacterized protein n=1 Tax=Pseudorhodoplanes sinuspersici TaxID=1235591 RepID=A0A1W6ZVE8_9HYPH|nr:hypothetical protein [Pseudorhodoplanes sinuspersici]ARQ01293.1 hypothetical protein CAK95_20980 [Pseudorhodoplanes sinuspersici]RKE72973.1 hypothetical protein DFP91_0847 [Pseudorhodoplanes sinuspersici]
MSRVAFSILAAAAISVSAVGSAQAGCGCNTDYAVASVVVQPAPVLVQPAPVMVAVQPPPVLVQPAPIVQQYVVNQGPLYAGPMLTDYNPAIYYAPRAVGGFPYVSGYRAAYGPRPYRPYRGYPPLRRYY